MSENLLSYAKNYASLGYNVFPCQPDVETVPDDRRKAPITKNGCKAGTTDLQQVEEWWKRTPNANIGFHCTGLIVVDVDGANNPFKSANHRTLMATGCSVATSPRGGTHYFFKKPKDFNVRNSVKLFADNVDIRTDGGYVIVAPSTILGNPYTWLSQPFSGPDDLPEPPEFVLNRLAKLAERQRVSASNVEYTIPTSASADRIYRYICSADKAISFQKGHDTTFGVLGRLWWGFALSEDELRQWAPVYNAERCDPPWKPEDLDHKIESVLNRWHPLDNRPRGSLLTGSTDFTDDDCDRYITPLLEANAARRTQFQKDLECVNTTDIEDNSEDDFEVVPPQIPVEWFYEVPGLMKRIIQYSMDYAPYPNPWMSFAAALAMMSFLTARTISGPFGERTNLYIFGLGLSGSGKDFPRDTNKKILDSLGLLHLERNNFASSEAIEDMMTLCPLRLAQTDEIAGLLEQAANSRSMKSSIVDVLLQMYTSSKSSYAIRSKAGKEESERVIQPHLVVLGTSTSKECMSAMTESMLSGGLLSRMFTIEGGERSMKNYNASNSVPLPDVIVRTAKLWIKEYEKTEKNPCPSVLPCSEEALQFLRQTSDYVDGTLYKQAERENNNTEASVWARVVEQATKLAILYTASDNLHDTWVRPSELVIGLPALEWGVKMAICQAERMLWKTSQKPKSKIQQDCQEVLEFLENAKNNTRTRYEISRKLRRLSAKELDEILATLESQGVIARKLSDSTGGRRAEIIVLIRKPKRKK